MYREMVLSLRSKAHGQDRKEHWSPSPNVHGWVPVRASHAMRRVSPASHNQKKEYPDLGRGY